MKPAKSVETSIQSETTQGSWPLRKSERTWTAWGLSGVALSGGVAAWSYSIGGYVAYYLNATMGTIAMIAGCLVGMLLVFLASVPVSTKYGLETIVTSKPQFGVKGSVLSIFLQFASIVGWNCLLIILFGRAVGEVLSAAGVISPSSSGMISIIFSVIAISISWLALRGGANAVRNASGIIAILVALTGLIIMYKLVSTVGIGKIASAEPLASSGDRLWDYTIGFEILVASVLSWLPYMGGIVRMVSSAKKALWPTMLGMGLPTGIISLIGLYSALATGNYDPTKWFVEVGGLYFGFVALAFLALANIGTAIVGAYATGVGLRQIEFIQKRFTWNQTTLIVLLPVVFICIFIPTLFMDSIPSFLTLLGVAFAPIVGIQIVDYFFLRKQQLSVHDLYYNRKESKYYYFNGINIAGFLAFGVGFIVYMLLLNPFTYESAEIFKYTTASIPSAICAGLAYAIFNRLINIPYKKGGYYSKAVDLKEQ